MRNVVVPPFPCPDRTVTHRSLPKAPDAAMASSLRALVGDVDHPLFWSEFLKRTIQTVHGRQLPWTRRSPHARQRQWPPAVNGGGGRLGFAMALWRSSAALVSLIDALNQAYDTEEARPWWKVQLTAMWLPSRWRRSSWCPSPW